MISTDEIMERLRHVIDADCTREARAFVDVFVTEINAEFEALRSLIEPGSQLETQIVDRVAEQTELRALERDERRDHELHLRAVSRKFGAS